jgi:RNA polymerase sigma-70 factor, ECF subfamily
LDSSQSYTKFEELIRENEGIIHKVCRIYTFNEADHQDLFQEIILQVWRAHSNFRNQSKYSTWIYRIGINTAITGLRSKKNVTTAYDPSDLPALAGVKEPEEEEDNLHELYRAIEKLNEIEKAIVMLYLEDKSYDEMEEILGISSGTLRVKMNRVKEKLRQLTNSITNGTGRS